MKITIEVNDIDEARKLRDGLLELSEQAHDVWMCGGDDDDKKEEKLFHRLWEQASEQVRGLNERNDDDDNETEEG